VKAVRAERARTAASASSSGGCARRPADHRASLSADGRWFAAGGERWVDALGAQPWRPPASGAARWLSRRITAIAFGGSGRPLLALPPPPPARLWDRGVRATTSAGSRPRERSHRGRRPSWRLPGQARLASAPSAPRRPLKGARRAPLRRPSGRCSRWARRENVSTWTPRRTSRGSAPSRRATDRSLALDLGYLLPADGTVAFVGHERSARFGNDVVSCPAAWGGPQRGPEESSHSSQRTNSRSRGDAAGQGHVAARGIKQLAAAPTDAGSSPGPTTVSPPGVEAETALVRSAHGNQYGTYRSPVMARCSCCPVRSGRAALERCGAALPT
jgi:hypothetical protein